MNTNIINACLELFKVVPQSESVSNTPVVLIQHGVVIHPEASTYAKEIEAYLDLNTLRGEDLNKSFHKSWQTILESTEEELIAHQLVHYFSTYGLQSLGLYSEDTIYIPEEVLEVPVKLGFKVIKAVSNEELINRCKSLLESGVALVQDTITKLLDILEVLEYPLSNVECKNKEAKVLIIDRTGILPLTEDELFRYIYYKATGGLTLVVNSKESKQLILGTGYEVPLLTDSQLMLLAQSYNRHKDLWLSMKIGNRANARTVNRIGKLSKKHHKPMKMDVLNSLTSTEFSPQVVKDAASNAIVFRLIRAINAVRFYMEEKENRTYRIRNGKSYTKVKPTITEDDLLFNYHEILLAELKSRLKVHSVYYPSNVDYALPVSEKAFVGNIPMGTIFTLPKKEEGFLIGIYWKGDYIDLDLRGESLTESVGWNTTSKGEGLLYSGDITSAPNGATEWLYTRYVPEVYDIKVNGYSGAEIGYNFKVILGYGDKPDKSYIIDSNKVVYELDLTLAQTQMSLGLLECEGDDLRFYLGGLGTGNSNVGRFTNLTSVMNKAIISKGKSSLRLSDLIPSVSQEEAELNLSPSELTKDSLLSLFM
jgi:hypothetical protein